MSCLLKQFQDEMIQWKTEAKKTPNVLVQSLGFQNFRHNWSNQKPKLMAIFSSNYSLELYLPKFLGPCYFLPFFLINVFQKKSLLLKEELQIFLYLDNTLPSHTWAYFQVLRRGSAETFFALWTKKYFYSVCANFKLILVFSSNLCNVY